MSNTAQIPTAADDSWKFTQDYIQLKQDTQEKLDLMNEIDGLHKELMLMKSVGAALPALMSALEQITEMDMLLTADHMKLNSDLQTMAAHMRELINKGKDITLDESTQLCGYIRWFMDIQYFADGAHGQGGLNPDTAKALSQSATDLLHNGIGAQGYIGVGSPEVIQYFMKLQYEDSASPNVMSGYRIPHRKTIQNDMSMLNQSLASMSKQTTLGMQFRRNDEKGYVGAWHSLIKTLIGQIEKAVQEMAKGSRS